VRLDPRTTKNAEGLVFPLTVRLRTLLEVQKAARDATARGERKISPFVFTRAGAEIRTFRKAWEKACREAGCPGKIPHDLPRTAVRNLVRASVTEAVAMKLTGHKTRSVFERYNIVNGGGLRRAVSQLEISLERSASKG
jgi:integrase